MKRNAFIAAAVATTAAVAGASPGRAQTLPVPVSLTPAATPAPAALPAWDPATYPDELGFRRRVAPMIPLLAKRDVGVKCMAASTCPDTGLTVRTFAVKGEEIVSPYTGRRYVQGETGYFGPKARGADGRITAFGGDPLKQDLPPAIARLLLNPDDKAVRAFLSVPGSLRQHYHFAAANWGRFYPLLAEIMGPEWRAAFKESVATYAESRRPSDGARENAPLSRPHDLLGVPGELLGGPVKDGGTENHKTMWRTAGLLYAQLLGPDAKVSGRTAAEAEKHITPLLTEYLRTILTVGNGEYDSSTYYPHSLRGYLNLYDFSPKPETRDLARAMLDYYLAGYGLKTLAGVHAGAVKRGWPGDGDAFYGDTMDAHLWAWVEKGNAVPADPATLITSIQQATTTYRPNRVLYNLAAKNVPLPFEAKIARPTYHSKEANAFQETFYCDASHALGSVAMTMVDNPTQQTVWSLVCRDESGALVFGGGQPRYRHPEGHSPYDQTLQKGGALLVVTGPTRAAKGDRPTVEQRSRADNASAKLSPPTAPPLGDRAALAAWWEAAPQTAATWLFVPRRAGKTLEKNGAYFIEAGDAYVAVRPFGGDRPFWLAPDPEGLPKELAVLAKYRVLIVPARSADDLTGYAVDTAPRSAFPSVEAFAAAAASRASAPTRSGMTVAYRSLAGDALSLTYRPEGLRADASLNGTRVDWAGWANGGVYESPYLTIKDGRMTVSDGRESYTMSLPAAGPDGAAYPTWSAAGAPAGPSARP